ncbi:MAG: response regulator transcription factor [Myxococcales bacterium]|nr:response regulator transcription factor [Myxococcales bacterium]
MAKLLLVDDDPSVLDALDLAFGDAGHLTERASDGRAALARLRAEPFDLVVSDVNMPHLDGYALCRRLREGGMALPILLLTGRDNEVDEALGLDLGADDYLTKPFSVRILVARVEALLRRDRLRADKERATAEVRAGHLAIDTDRLRATYRSVELTLTVTELRVLEAFAKNPGTVLGRARLLDIVRGDESVVGERLIDTYVKRLRRKLDEIEPGFDRIETVIGAGYKWRS